VKESAAMSDAVQQATSAVLQVGGGRGFIVDANGDRYVITAAHCLPFFSPYHAAMSYLEYVAERTYQKLIASLGREPTVSAECLFVDPIADIAVLGSPDDEELSEEAEGWESLIDDAEALAIASLPKEATVWLLSLDGQWRQAHAQHRGHGGGIWLSRADKFERGMSGSPILTVDGRAVGVFGLSSGAEGEAHTRGGPQARLTAHLPAWILWEK
jgi:hypothetical protein